MTEAPGSQLSRWTLWFGGLACALLLRDPPPEKRHRHHHYRPHL